LINLHSHRFKPAPWLSLNQKVTAAVLAFSNRGYGQRYDHAYLADQRLPPCIMAEGAPGADGRRYTTQEDEIETPNASIIRRKGLT